MTGPGEKWEKSSTAVINFVALLYSMHVWRKSFSCTHTLHLMW